MLFHTVRIALAVTMAFFLGSSESASAYAGGGGDGGCCGVPPALEADAARFEAEITVTPEERVRRLMFVGELCAPNGFACGELTEAQAKELATWRLAAGERAWDLWIKIGLGLLALYGAALSTKTTFWPRKAKD